MNKISEIIKDQKIYFESNETKKIAFRKNALRKLQASIKENELDILNALKYDLNKSEFEAFESELGIVYEDIKYMIKNIDKFSKTKRKHTPLMHFYSSSYQYQEPYGTVLIMSPWNYPFQLTIIPLIGAIAAGNCCVVKPSNYSKATTKVIQKILCCFDESYVSVIDGGREANQQLLDEKFDYIFFTGSPKVGKLVMEKACKHLTPITLELGGKSPCIVDETAKIDLSAKRIVWGKLLNSGQTCIAPDYILVHESVKDKLVVEIEKYIKVFFGETPITNEEYPKIINMHHYERLCELLSCCKEVIGGLSDINTLKIAPAIIKDCDWNDKVMQDEIFGPILPIIAYNDLDKIISEINNRPKPLALYYFTKSKANEKKVLSNVSFGGGCINDTLIHCANSNMSFGGVGQSGMGSYHGKQTYYTFSHTKSIMKKSTLFDINVRYAPYKDKIKLLRKIF